MWWTLLVARFFEIVLKSVQKVNVIPDIFSYKTSLRWKLKGAYPYSWLILSAVMLHLQFVGVTCGTFWNHSMIQGHSIFKIRLQSWVQNPDREPPAPFGTAYPVSSIIKNSLPPVVDVVKHSRDIYFGYSTNILYQASKECS